MPRPSQGPRLYLRERTGREATWVIRDAGGVEVGTGCGAGSRGEAEKRLEAYLADKHRPRFKDKDPERIKVADVLNLYATEVGPVMARPELAGFDVPKLTAFFGNKVVAEVTKGSCRAYVKWRTAQPRSQYKDPAAAPRITVSTARRELVTLKAAIRYAWSEGKLSAPVPVHLPDEASARERWLTRDEVARLLWAAWRTNRHVARFILVALYTGTRHAAILGLRWEKYPDTGWVDLESGLIFRRGEDEAQTKKRRPPVPISPRLAAHMRRWRASGRTHVIEWLREVKTVDGKETRSKPLLKLRRSWNRARKLAKLGPDVTPHILRHTFATWAVQEGKSLAKIAATIGSTEEMVEDRYGHHDPEHLRDVVEAVSGAKLGRGTRRKPRNDV